MRKILYPYCLRMNIRIEKGGNFGYRREYDEETVRRPYTTNTPRLQAYQSFKSSWHLYILNRIRIHIDIVLFFCFNKITLKYYRIQLHYIAGSASMILDRLDTFCYNTI